MLLGYCCVRSKLSYKTQSVVNGLPALGIGARRGIEPCAVERSTEANA